MTFNGKPGIYYSPNTLVMVEIDYSATDYIKYDVFWDYDAPVILSYDTLKWLLKECQYLGEV